MLRILVKYPVPGIIPSQNMNKMSIIGAHDSKNYTTLFFYQRVR